MVLFSYLAVYFCDLVMRNGESLPETITNLASLLADSSALQSYISHLCVSLKMIKYPGKALIIPLM